MFVIRDGERSTGPVVYLYSVVRSCRHRTTGNINLVSIATTGRTFCTGTVWRESLVAGESQGSCIAGNAHVCGGRCQQKLRSWRSDICNNVCQSAVSMPWDEPDSGGASLTASVTFDILTCGINQDHGNGYIDRDDTYIGSLVVSSAGWSVAHG